MKIRNVLIVLVLMGLTALVTTQVVSQEAGKPEKSSGKGAAPGEPSPEMVQFMEKIKAAGTPGPEHAKLAKRAGSWDYKIKFRMDANAPWNESTGTNNTEVIMGGRFLVDKVTGTFGPEPFHGMGITGFDNVTKKYVNIWFDSMITAIMTTEGTPDATGKVITFTGTCSCPIAGGPKKTKSVLSMTDDNHFSYQGFDYAPDGKEFLAMEIHYTRAAVK